MLGATNFSKTRKVRFAPIVLTAEGPAHVGPLLNLSRNKDDFYIALRGSPQKTKISLHASGITRWAKIDLSPRSPIFRGELDDIEKRRWHTVFRAIYAPYADNFICGNLPENKIKFDGLQIPSLNFRSCVVYSFGYLSKNNIYLLERENDPLNKNLHIFELSNEKNAVAVLTGSYYSFQEITSAFVRFRRKKLTPHETSKWESFDGGPYTLISQFVSELYTHSLFFLHSIPHEISEEAAVSHPAFRLCGLLDK